MTDVFYLRPVSPPARFEDLPAMASQAQGCFGLHRVHWRMSFLALDGSEMLCWYRAPDAESARIALRQLGADMNGVWPGRPEPPLDGMPADSLAGVCVLATVPVALSSKVQEAVTGAAEARGGELVCRFDSLDGSRSVWCFRSAVEGDITEVFRKPAVPDARVWGCRAFVPELDAKRDRE